LREDVDVSAKWAGQYALHVEQDTGERILNLRTDDLDRVVKDVHDDD
jgi:hypothetical protein